MPDALIIVERTGKIIQTNLQAEKMFGYTRQEMLGQRVEMLVPERFRSQHAEERALYVSSPRVRPMGIGLELYGLRKDGTEFPVDISLSPIETKEGRQTIAVIRDMTERKRAEEALRRKEEHHRQVIENIFKFIPEGVLVLTESLDLLTHNKAFDDIVKKYAPLLGYSEEELAEKIIEQFRTKMLTGDTTEIWIPIAKPRIPEKSE